MANKSKKKNKTGIDGSITLDKDGNVIFGLDAKGGIANANISGKINRDGSLSVEGGVGTDVRLASVDIGASYTINTQTNDSSGEAFLDASKSVEDKLFGHKVGAKATWQVLKYEGTGRPSALDPNFQIETDKITTGLKFGGSISGKTFKGEAGGGFGVGGTRTKISRDDDPALREKALSDVSVTYDLPFIDEVGTFLNVNHPDYTENIRVAENTLGYLQRKIDRNNELSEIYDGGTQFKNDTNLRFEAIIRDALNTQYRLEIFSLAEDVSREIDEAAQSGKSTPWSINESGQQSQCHEGGQVLN